jgi:hypothetical protein
VAMTNDRPRITIDEAKIRERFEGSEELPSILDDKPAGEFTTLVHSLIDDGLIVVPEPYRLSLLNDDEIDITGVIVNVEVAGTGWPYISDGWSDIDNYLPHREHGDTVKPTAVHELLEGIHSIIGRADRCISFAHNVRHNIRPVGRVR